MTTIDKRIALPAQAVEFNLISIGLLVTFETLQTYTYDTLKSPAERRAHPWIYLGRFRYLLFCLLPVSDLALL